MKRPRPQAESRGQAPRPRCSVVPRAARRVIAYSLGNFVGSAGSPATARTGILRLGLSRRGVESAKLLSAVIEATRPRLLR